MNDCTKRSWNKLSKYFPLVGFMLIAYLSSTCVHMVSYSYFKMQSTKWTSHKAILQGLHFAGPLKFAGSHRNQRGVGKMIPWSNQGREKSWKVSIGVNPSRVRIGLKLHPHVQVELSPTKWINLQSTVNHARFWADFVRSFIVSGCGPVSLPAGRPCPSPWPMG